jgi:hypothetical protein
MEEMEAKFRGLQERQSEADRDAKKSSDKFSEMQGLLEKRIAQVSEIAKASSRKIEEISADGSKAKADTILQVNTMISRHERTFDATLGKIMVAVSRMEEETKRAESVYEKMVAARELMQVAPPPQARLPAHADTPRHILPAAPVPARLTEDPPSDPPLAPLAFNAYPQPAPPRHRPRRMPAFDDDLDDMDVDDVMAGAHGEQGLHVSVDDMHRNVSGIAEKLSAIEEAVSKMQLKKGSVEKLDDKIQAYTESVAGIHSRMDTIERAMKDGMTPMMESMKILADAVKDLKSKPSQAIQPIQRPTPPSKISRPELPKLPRHAPMPEKGGQREQPFRYRYRGVHEV